MSQPSHDLIPDQSPPEGSHPPANWLELFYDLVFVAAILVLSSAFAHGHSVEHGAWLVLSFISVWWIWLATTMFTNRFRLDDTPHRMLVLLQMFLVALVAMGASDGVRRDEVFLSIDYGLLVGTLAVMYARGARNGRGPVPFARRRAFEYLAAAILFVGLCRTCPSSPASESGPSRSSSRSSPRSPTSRAFARRHRSQSTISSSGWVRSH